MIVGDLSLLSWSPLVLSPLTRTRQETVMAISPSTLWITFTSPLFCYLKYTDKSANITFKDMTTFLLLIHQAWLQQNLPSLSTAIKRERKEQRQAKGIISVTPLMALPCLWIFLSLPVAAVNVCFCLKTLLHKTLSLYSCYPSVLMMRELLANSIVHSHLMDVQLIQMTRRSSLKRPLLCFFK